MSRNRPITLPTAYVALRVLIVVNWLIGLGILALLAAMFTSPLFTMKALGVAHFAQSTGLMAGMRVIPALGLVGVVLNFSVLTRLLAMVETVGRGDPFIAANADRLREIAWLLLGLQVLSIAIGLVAMSLSRPGHPIHLDAGFSTSGWLAVLLTFVLARVFAEGAQMREDLEGTV